MARDWQHWVQSWETSGQSQKQFCTNHNLDYNLFKTWRKQGIAKGVCQSKHPVSAKPQMNFSELKVSPSISSGDIVIELPHGITLRIPSHASCS